jgi:hypothetical protein
VVGQYAPCEWELFLRTTYAQGAQTLIKDADWPSGKAAVDFYFIQDDGGMFKCTLLYEPYFYIACKVSYIVLCNCDYCNAFTDGNGINHRRMANQEV